MIIVGEDLLNFEIWTRSRRRVKAARFALGSNLLQSLENLRWDKCQSRSRMHVLSTVRARLEGT